MKFIHTYFFALVLSSILFSCKKTGGITPALANKNTLNFVVRDNFGLSFLATALFRSGLEKELEKEGPFTLLAPSDVAYKASGFANQAAVYNSSISVMAQQNKYHILKSAITFANSPLGMNQPKETLLGSSVYISRVVKGLDTLTTVNGGRVIRMDTRASNGMMQVIDRVLVPNVFDKVQDALSSDVNLTLFYHALKRSGLLNELSHSQNYTIYAANNKAMESNGYGSISTIEQADPEVLKNLLSYHIAKERKFAQDYFLLAPVKQKTYTETMLDGRILTVNLLEQYNVPNSFTGITLKGMENAGIITPLKTDILSGNGVIHVIPELLK